LLSLAEFHFNVLDIMRLLFYEVAALKKLDVTGQLLDQYFQHRFSFIDIQKIAPQSMETAVRCAAAGHAGAWTMGVRFPLPALSLVGQAA
jgi:hypothetical protein